MWGGVPVTCGQHTTREENYTATQRDFALLGRVSCDSSFPADSNRVASSAPPLLEPDLLLGLEKSSSGEETPNPGSDAPKKSTIDGRVAS